MGTIRSSIELYDAFTTPMMNIINAVNAGVSSMEQMQSTMNSSVDITNMDSARNSVDQVTIAVQDLDAAMQGIKSPSIEMPTIPQNPEPIVVSVQPDVPDPLVSQPEPIQVPIQWKSDNLEIFTGTGIERFEQEVQSTNNMLSTLNNTQKQIAVTASHTNLFSPNMLADMNSLQNRIQAIQEQIQTIENNPLNLGTDIANSELEQLRENLNQAIQEQENLNRAVEGMDVQAANESYLRLSQTIGSTERYIRDNVDEQGRFNHQIEHGTNQANKLMRTIKGAVAAYVSIQSISTVLNLSDQITSTTARLDLMNDGLQTTKDLQNMIYLSAERSRGSYQATADAVSKLGLMAGDAFGSSEEIIAFMEQVNKQFRIAGTETAGIEAAMLQLTQAMGSGVLRGEEYNSILEQAPNIIQAIADYMEVPKGQLKDMAAEGLITAEIVKGAMFAAADETNTKFEQMPKTFSQIWTSFENTALMAFQPVLERMNEIANSTAFEEFINNVVGALTVVAGITLEVLELLISIANTVADNWSWLSPIIYGVAAALAVYYGWQLAVNAVTAISTMQKRLAAIQAIAHGAAITAEMTATTGLTAAQLSLNAAMYACPLTWIIVIIIALIAIIYAAVAAVNHFAGTTVSATGIICGAFMVALAFIGNIFIALWNLVVDVFVMIYNLVATVANFIGNVFIDPVGAVCRLFFDLADTVLSVLQTLASAIDTIFGSNLAGAVQGWRNSLGGWVDSTFGKGIEVMEKLNADDMKLGRFEYGLAWDAGYSFGEGIDNSIANLDPSNWFDSNIPNPNDYADLSNYAGSGAGINGIGDDVSDISGNTGSIADSLDVTNEDLKYLRDIAEQEAINRFTTAEIRVDAPITNNISSEMDLDGVVNGLTDAVNEAVDIIAEGVHI